MPPRNNHLLDATAEFMALGQQDMPAEIITPELRSLRRRMLRSEFTEYEDAEDEADLTEIADGLLDIIVVAWGTLLTYFGPELAEAMAHEVWSSNLAKVDGPGLPVFRDDGKILKPEGWAPPDIAGLLHKAGFLP